MPYPTDFKYTKEHEWVSPTGDTVLVGITDFAQRQLGDIVFVELPKVGRKLDVGEAFGMVESVKAANELYVPVSGEVTAINEDLAEEPEEVNANPHHTWMIKLKLTKPDELKGLLTAAQYEAYIAEEEAP
ncbi:glycine cleavage system protein GcvH [Kitasatospora sp. NPDC093558]|uniref:glycine cleavage system protein GcvH n=1 Tax=Kitasatospora sp. NPDC093558 TaxID=3155201 RepID=UPI0034328BD8